MFKVRFLDDEYINPLAEIRYADGAEYSINNPLEIYAAAIGGDL